MFFRYIHGHEVEEYIAQGWTVVFWKYYSHGLKSFIASKKAGGECLN